VNSAYPLTITVGLQTFGKKIRVVDANGLLVVHAHQKAARLKEDVTVYADELESQPLCRLKGMDLLGLAYSIETLDGLHLGGVKLSTAPMLSSDTYDIVDENDAQLAHVHAADRLGKLAAYVLGGVPLVNAIVFRLIKPSYLFDDASGTTLLRLRVLPSVGEGRFLLERESSLSERLERLALPAALIVTMIERGHI
jgi:hypothetical protein